MNIINRVIAGIVGAVFVFSGLLKLNDPIGTEIKLEEYFEVFKADQSLGLSALSGFWEVLLPYSLALAVMLSTFEIILGVRIALWYKIRNTLLSLLVLLIFFGFLTFYSAYFNKVTDCGCFGDAIKLTPWQSFWKDMLLLAATVFLAVQNWRNATITQPTNPAIGFWASTAASFFSLGLAIYTISYLPLIDFLPYKVGAHIPTLMKPSAELRYEYIMEKNGKQETFQQYPTDTTYKFKEAKLINPEDMPKITDYNIWNDTGNYKDSTFKGKKLLVIIQEPQKSFWNNFATIEALAKALKQKNIQTMLVTASDQKTFLQFKKEFNITIPHYFADKTVLKTMIRANPGLIYLENGTIKAKWHYNRLPSDADF
ncbi:MAG: DoxX family protein [Cytophagales bacterium]|nr:MAG: DoxX family protein [Cytophagales bacterium]